MNAGSDVEGTKKKGKNVRSTCGPSPVARAMTAIRRQAALRGKGQGAEARRCRREQAAGSHSGAGFSACSRADRGQDRERRASRAARSGIRGTPAVLKKSLETPKSVVAETGVESVPASEPERATAGGGGSFRSRLFPRWLLSRRCGEAWELLLPGPLPPTPLLPLLPLNPLASASVPPNNACPLQPAWLSAGAPCPLTLPCLSEGHYGDLSLRGRVLGAGPACSRPPRVHP